MHVDADELLHIMAEFVDLSRSSIDENSTFGDDIPLDSRDMLRLLARIHSRYNIKIKPRDIFQIKNFGDLKRTISRYGKSET